METFSALLAICAGNSPVNSPHKGQWRGALMFSLIWAWINGWVNNGEAGDLRRHRAHHDVIVTSVYCIQYHGGQSAVYPVMICLVQSSSRTSKLPCTCTTSILYWLRASNVRCLPHFTQVNRRQLAGIILSNGSANERWRYIVTSYLIGWTHTHGDQW